MPIRIELTANDAAELAAMIQALAPIAGAQGVKFTNPVVSAKPNAVSATVSLEPMDGGDEETADDPAPEIPEATEPKATKKGKKVEAPDNAAIRDQAVALCHVLFNKSPELSKAVMALRDKYSIKKFTELPLERAAEFLADAQALESKAA